MGAIESIARREQTVQLLHSLGYIYGCHGHTKRALVLLLIAARFAPDDVGVLRTLAHAFLLDGAPDRAASVIDRLRGMQGADHPTVDLLASHALWATGRAIEARRTFREFLDRRRER
jgi:type III secretion protein Y